MTWLARAVAAALLLAIAAPVAVYATYPDAAWEAAVAAVEAGGAPQEVGGLAGVYAGLEALRGFRGHVTVEGVVEYAWMHAAVLRAGEGRILVSLMGCWLVDGRVAPGHLVASSLQGARVVVEGYYVSTASGPVLVAERVSAPGFTAVQGECPMHGPMGPVHDGGGAGGEAGGMPMHGPMHGMPGHGG